MLLPDGLDKFQVLRIFVLEEAAPHVVQKVVDVVLVAREVLGPDLKLLQRADRDDHAEGAVLALASGATFDLYFLREFFTQERLNDMDTSVDTHNLIVHLGMGIIFFVQKYFFLAQKFCLVGTILILI